MAADMPNARKGRRSSEALPEASLGARSGAPADPDGGSVSYWCSHALSLSGSALCPMHAAFTRTEFLERTSGTPNSSDRIPGGNIGPLFLVGAWFS